MMASPAGEGGRYGTPRLQGRPDLKTREPQRPQDTTQAQRPGALWGGRHPQRARDTPQAGGNTHPPSDADRPPPQPPPRSQARGPGTAPRERTSTAPDGPAPGAGHQQTPDRTVVRAHPGPGGGQGGGDAANRRQGTRGPRRATHPNPPGRAPTNTQERMARHEQSIPHQDPLSEGPETTAGQEAEPRQEPTEPPGRHPAHPPQGHGTPQTPGTQQHHHDVNGLPGSNLQPRRAGPPEPATSIYSVRPPPPYYDSPPDGETLTPP
ncbi:proline-rich protein 2-like [Epinephelus fuscoguttatus]|uniref:proline-rich protein 2-like n=1 Tax=Epinephelus fuscoguttatus TaxID=293821 RepID=UPI0020D0C313|nr:proline-rich protein 2-like [Epinephelus fuscoguttatus]